ncbi:hypothetical protein ACC739_38300, partial [Rhizobium ruizarguesonis]
RREFCRGTSSATVALSLYEPKFFGAANACATSWKINNNIFVNIFFYSFPLNDQISMHCHTYFISRLSTIT